MITFVPAKYYLYIMKTLNLITFSSQNSTAEGVVELHRELFSILKKEYEIRIIPHKDLNRLDPNEFNMILISTGKVGNEIINKYEYLPHPLTIIADGKGNSLGDAIEVMSWANSQSVKADIIYGQPEDILGKINTYYKIYVTQRALKGKKIGVIGTPAKWLVSSEVNYLLAQRRWGIEFVDINQDDVQPLFENVMDEDIDSLCESLVSKARECRDIVPEDLVKSVKMYKAVKKICTENGFDAVTLNCNRMQKRLKMSSDIPLSLLNNDGVPAGNEGDLQSIFTMLMARELTGENAFMGNIGCIDQRDNSVTMAHCSISTDMTKEYILRSHYETNEGVAVQGVLDQQDVTVVKCGGECLDEYFVSHGIVMPHEHDEHSCRTQIKVRLNSPVSYFLENPIGNHHILIRGNHEKIINDFLQSNSCKRIK